MARIKNVKPSQPVEPPTDNESSEEGVEEAPTTYDESPENPVEEAPLADEEASASNEMQPIPPERFYFHQSKWGKTSKIITKCFLSNTVEFIKNEVGGDELRWFENHPQFQHLFHMPISIKSLCTGIWMLLLRAIRTDKKEELWFVLNGVPFRYSIKEHAIITGLNCSSRFPPSYMETYKKSRKFVGKYFGTDPTVNEVREKILLMKSGNNRRRMTLLYFLSTVILTKAREDTIYGFLLSIIDDDRLCNKFSWGRLTFEHIFEILKSRLNKFNGNIPKCNATVQGFVIPFELFPYECIASLKNKYLEEVEAPSARCPLLCRRKIVNIPPNGHNLNEMYTDIGDSKEISSLLPVEGDKRLVDNVEADNSSVNLVVDGWKTILEHGREICFKELWERDIHSRETWETDVDAAPPAPVADDATAHNAAPAVPAAHDAAAPIQVGAARDAVIKSMKNQLRSTMKTVDALVKQVEVQKKMIISLKKEVHELQKRDGKRSLDGGYNASPGDFDYGPFGDAGGFTPPSPALVDTGGVLECVVERGGDGGVVESVGDDTGHVVERGGDDVGDVRELGGDDTGHVVEHGGDVVGDVLERGGDVVGDVLERGSDDAGDGLEMDDALKEGAIEELPYDSEPSPTRLTSITRVRDDMDYVLDPNSAIVVYSPRVLFMVPPIPMEIEGGDLGKRKRPPSRYQKSPFFTYKKRECKKIKKN